MLEIKKKKIILKYVVKYWILLFLPLSIFISIRSCSSFNKAGENFTPTSVHVSGYTRKDGTKVRSYNRRPPGSVAQDAPYARTRFYSGIIFLASTAFGIGYIYIVLLHSSWEIEERKEKIKKLNLKRKEIYKHIEGKRITNSIENEINFNLLPDYPRGLLRDNNYYCKFSHYKVEKSHFHIKYKAVTYFHRVCLEHLCLQDKIGRGQKSSMYNEEIKYYKKYNILYQSFKKLFLEKVEEPKEYTDEDFSNYFYNLTIQNTAHNIGYQQIAGIPVKNDILDIK